MKKNFYNWDLFHKNFQNYPCWPNEILVKLINGKYLKKPIKLKNKSRILDVGCGFGNNLLPFNKKSYELFGTEVSNDIAKIASKFLSSVGVNAIIKKGFNKSLPFENNYFDLLISINVLHYENSEKDMLSSLKEYKRVLKKNGDLIVFTVGPEHLIFKKSKPLGNHIYQIQNWDFRNDEKYFYFESLKYLEFYFNKFFNEIETARVTESLMQKPLDFLIVKANK